MLLGGFFTKYHITMAHPYDHATTGNDLLIYNLVRNRLPAIVDNPANKLLISNFTWEIMNQLEVCFKIASGNGTIDPPDPTRIGHEENYSAIQQSIIADLVTILIMAMNEDPTTPGTSTGTTFLKKAKAGSVEVEYDQFKNAGTLVLGTASLMNFYKKAAINKAAQLGCIIDICDDCTMSVQLASSPEVMPFITFRGGCCDGCGS